MKEMLMGVLAMGFFVAGLIFLRFWKSTQERFFLFFAVAFWIEATNRVLMALVDLPDSFPLVYLIRLCAFILILFAILDKNRSRR
jgi:hypothetical protein